MKNAEEIKKIEQEKDKQILPPVYSQQELDHRSLLITRMNNAKTSRDTSHKELDDMDYLTFYETNAEAANSYIQEKKNPEDIRIVTGITKEKENTLLSSLLNYNFEANITAYDEKDQIINELGSVMEDLVKKSREIEDYDLKRAFIYRELLDQGNCFVEEKWTIKYRCHKKVQFNWEDGVKFSNYTMKEEIKKDFEGCESRLIPGTKVYLGNVKEPLINNQPYLFTVESVPYSTLKTEFASWERWKNVPRKVVKTTDTSDNIEYRDWTLLESKEDYVEIIKYYNQDENEFQIFFNGVMMLPCYFPLQEISPSGKYPLSKGDIESMAFFAYAKGVPAKTKVDQAVIDEMFKMAILKTQMSFRPSMANNTGQEINRNIFTPGIILDDINPDKLKSILPEQNGITNNEMAFMTYMKDVIDSKSVNAVFMGEQPAQGMTATQVMEMKKQQLMKLGQVVWGVVMLERQMAWLRIQNILKNYTKSIDTKFNELTEDLDEVYRTFEMDTTLSDGREGRKIIEFSPRAEEITPEQVELEEGLLSEYAGKSVQKIYLNPLALTKLKANWVITINPTEKNSTELQRMLFIQTIKEAIEIFGPQSINFGYLKERFSILANEDPDKFFVQEQMMPGMEVMMGGANMTPPQMASNVANDLKNSAQPKNPSLNQITQ